MIETKPRINRGNRGQLFRASWLSSAWCSETFRRTTERVECSAKCTWQRLRTGLNPPDPCPRHGVTTNNEQRTRKISLSCISRGSGGFKPVRSRCHVHLAEHSTRSVVLLNVSLHRADESQVARNSCPRLPRLILGLVSSMSLSC